MMPNRTAFAAQIRPEHIEQIKADGFKTVINNRPDGEEPNQPTNADIEQAARAAGLAYYHQPVVASQINADDAQTFADIFNAAEKPVLMFCRTGNRCQVLYSQAEHLDLLD